ncbi:MAG: WecB/TagA/CpsF family glycosyltransferase [Frankiaceae bacterium]
MSLDIPVRPARVSLGGALVDLMNHDQVLHAVREQLAARQPSPLCLASANLDHLGHFGGAARSAHPLEDDEACKWLVLLDGKPLQWVANRLTHSSCELLAGSDLLPDLLAVAATSEARVGVLGGSEASHRALRPLLHRRYPDLAVAGMWAPSREELVQDEGQLGHAIQQASVDMLVVALGKPRQEEWLHANAVPSGIKLGLAFGAAIDFLTGTARRAPAWWREHGIEWGYRLLHEPRRLSRRYLVRGPREALTLLTGSSATGEHTVAGLCSPTPRSIIAPVPLFSATNTANMAATHRIARDSVAGGEWRQ